MRYPHSLKRKKAKPPPRSPDELIATAQGHVEQGELEEAEARYREALALAPDHLGALSLLGILLVDREDIDAAIELLERARDLAPSFAPVQLALGNAYAAAGHDELAIAAMETAISLDTASTLPLERLAKHHIIARRTREAIGLLRRVLRRNPDNAQAKFLLAGLTGAAENAQQPDPALIADLFDSYAARFDEHLVEKLEYRVPTALAALIASTSASADGSWHVLDLGCGTGLAGIELRAYARTLIGSDLSARMIARARKRGIYDELHVEDLAATLARARDVDLIVAADVFLYIGTLDTTLAACAAALRPGGLLAFSIERGAEDVVLERTLRYAHSDTYVRGVASAQGLTLETAEPSVLRIENGEPVHGMLYLFRR